MRLATTKNFLSTKEVAEKHGVHQYTVMKWCRENRIWPATYVSGRWQIAVDHCVQPNYKVGRPLGSKDKKPRVRTKK